MDRRKKAVFKNIIIENADVEARTNVGILLGEGNGSVIIGSKVSGNVRGINNTGGLVGYLWGTGCRVVNCKSYANVDCQVSDAGGLIGFNLQAEITGCHTYGNVVCDTNVGGLIGRLRGTNQITDCHFHGKTQGLTQYAGGLVGIAEKASLSNLITIDDCSVSGKVTGQNDVGGLIGQIKDVPVNMTKSRILNQIAGGNQVGGLIGSLIGGNAQIAGCYVLENVSATGDEIGGLIGYAGAMLTVSNSFARGDVEGGKHVGGLVGRTIAAYSSITDTYSMGDIQSSVSSSVGGLVGWSRKITINRCFATGKITTPKPGDPSAGSGGGLVGKFEDNSVIQNSMALNSYMWGLGVFGRVIGEVNGSTITNVYAFDEMKSLEDDSILPEGNVNDKNGKNVAKSNAAGEVNKDFWTNPAKLNWSNFDSNWEFVSGTNLPQLKNLPASPDPEHFK